MPMPPEEEEDMEASCTFNDPDEPPRDPEPLPLDPPWLLAEGETAMYGATCAAVRSGLTSSYSAHSPRSAQRFMAAPWAALWGVVSIKMYLRSTKPLHAKNAWKKKR